jgi:hypothetical protein
MLGPETSSLSSELVKVDVLSQEDIINNARISGLQYRDLKFQDSQFSIDEHEYFVELKEKAK